MKTIAILTSLLLTACSTLQSPFYIGERVPFEADDVGNETVWKVNDDLYHVRIVNTNLIVAASLKWDEPTGSFQKKTQEVVVSKLNETLFVNLRKNDLYTVLRATPSDEFIVFYTAEDAEIKKHLGTRCIESAEGDDTYVLQGTKKEIDAFVTEHLHVLFSQDAILIGELISGELP